MNRYNEGYNKAKRCIEEGNYPLELLNQARSALTNDSFDQGWKAACKELIKKG